MPASGKKNKSEEEMSEQENIPVKETKQKDSKSKNNKMFKGGSKSPKKMAGKKQKGGKKGKAGNKDREERYFRLIDPKTGHSFGRYTGDTPKQAASKGYTKILQKLKTKGKTIPKTSIIYLRESTRGSARKVYGYEASRQKLDKPQVLEIEDEDGGTKTIVYHYRNKIKKVPVPEQIGGVKIARSKKNAKKESTKSGKNKTKKSSSKTAKATKKSSTKKQQTAKASSSN